MRSDKLVGPWQTEEDEMIVIHALNIRSTSCFVTNSSRPRHSTSTAMMLVAQCGMFVCSSVRCSILIGTDMERTHCNDLDPAHQYTTASYATAEHQHSTYRVSFVHWSRGSRKPCNAQEPTLQCDSAQVYLRRAYPRSPCQSLMIVLRHAPK